MHWSSTSGSPIQATIPGAAALERVQALMETIRSSTRTNPNRVRALVGTFAFANPTGFNRADGEGYRFLARQILDIDQRNPQLAARILTSMRSWRSLEPFAPIMPAPRCAKSTRRRTFRPTSRYRRADAQGVIFILAYRRSRRVICIRFFQPDESRTSAPYHCEYKKP